MTKTSNVILLDLHGTPTIGDVPATGVDCLLGVLAAELGSTAAPGPVVLLAAELAVPDCEAWKSCFSCAILSNRPWRRDPVFALAPGSFSALAAKAISI